MGDVINLNQYRKQRERDRKAKKARENRARHGRSGAEKAVQRHEAEKSAKDLDRNRIAPVADDAGENEAGTTREPPEGTTPSTG